MKKISLIRNTQTVEGVESVTDVCIQVASDDGGWWQYTAWLGDPQQSGAIAQPWKQFMKHNGCTPEEIEEAGRLLAD